MINPTVFVVEMAKLAVWFNKEIPDHYMGVLKRLLEKELTTEQFLQACEIAMRDHKYFPTPAEMINSIFGTIEERAIAQFADRDRLSVIGAKALESIGGEWDLQRSSHYDLLRRDFIVAYTAFAKFSTEPSDLRMPDPLPAIAPAEVERSFCFVPFGSRMKPSGEPEFIWQYKGFSEEPTREELRKIFLDVLQKSADGNRLNRIIDGVHILKDPTEANQEYFDSPKSQEVIEYLKGTARMALAKQIRLNEEARQIAQQEETCQAD